MRIFRLLYPFFFRNAPRERCSCSLYSSLANDSSRALSEYLVTGIGFLPDEAVKVCEKSRSRSPHVNLERVVGVLRESGLGDAQIRKAVSRNHQLLGLQVEKTLMPKMKAFQDWGLSAHEIADMVETNPYILNSSLEKVLIPIVGVLKTVLPSDKKLSSAIKSLFSGLGTGPKVEKLETHVSNLRSLGVPDSSLWRMLVKYSPMFHKDPCSLERAMVELHQLGFGYTSGMFPGALWILSRFSKSTWNFKVEVLKGYGWSEESVMKAFRKAPTFMGLSSSRLQRKLDYFTKELNFTAAVLAETPVLLMYSLEKRVIPRVAVMRKLESSEILRRKWNLATILTYSEDVFCQNFGFKHRNRCPEVVQVYIDSKKRIDDHAENVEFKNANKCPEVVRLYSKSKVKKKKKKSDDHHIETD